MYIMCPQLEQQQRADARERKEKGVEWQQKLFHLEGERWMFNSPLDQRKDVLTPTEEGVETASPPTE